MDNFFKRKGIYLIDKILFVLRFQSSKAKQLIEDYMKNALEEGNLESLPLFA